MTQVEPLRDVVVVGGGQAGLALGFYLRRSSLEYVIVDDQGGGNSGAQIVAVPTEPDSGVASVTWATLQPPSFLPDEIRGRYLFEQATTRYKAQQVRKSRRNSPPNTPRP